MPVFVQLVIVPFKVECMFVEVQKLVAITCMCIPFQVFPPSARVASRLFYVSLVLTHVQCPAVITACFQSTTTSLLLGSGCPRLKAASKQQVSQSILQTNVTGSCSDSWFLVHPAMPNSWPFTSVPGCEYAKEKLFFELNDTIPYVGVMLGVIVAKTWAQAYKAARAVKQVYIDLKPPVLGIVDALTKHAVLCQDHVSRIRSVGKHILRGAQVGEPLPDQGTTKRSTRSQNLVSSVMTGEQYHFPLETHALCVVPTSDTMQIFISSQCNDIVQSAVVGALGVLTSKIRVEGMCIGGGFGGKIIAQAASACAIAVAAHKLKQPVRLQTERRNDMQAFGLRNSFKFDYDATFLSDGKLEACDLNVHLDVGHIPGISGLLTTILDKDVGGVYNFTGGLKLSHQVCLTNKPAAAVMRAPGAMQASFFQASLLDHIAKTVSS